MAFQALTVVVGVILGWLRGGSIWALSNVRLKWIWIVPVAYIIQYISVYHLRGFTYEILLVLSYASLIIFCILNRRVPGVKWALCGILANFTVMLTNGLRMPAYLPAVAKTSPQLVPLLMKGEVGKSVAMTAQTHLNFLGDIFSIHVGPPTLVSIGDLMFAAGIILFINYAMRQEGGEKLGAQLN